MNKTGKVYLIGAGPGHAGLITVRGKELLEACDAVVYDHLVPAEHLAYAGKALKIYAGKKGGLKSASQETINRRLWFLAKQGKTVVRLKGGDPFIFGRGGEEIAYLMRHKIPFEAVPGVTAALGAAAYAGIPLTHRGLASQVTFVTAHEDPAKGSALIDWDVLAKSGGTLVFYMGATRLDQLTSTLIRKGLSSKTPAAVVECATLPSQKTVRGTLGDIAKKAGQAGIGTPALTVVGKVVNLRNRVDWFSRLPLSGKAVLVTRARAQAGRLSRELLNLGARVIDSPMIKILPPATWAKLDAAIDGLRTFDWAVFTSANGVEKFMNRLCALKKDTRVFGDAKICAIGPATADKLKEYSLHADAVPPDYVSESLVSFLAGKEDLRGKKLLLVRSNLGRDYLPKAFRKLGARVHEVTAYRTRRDQSAGRSIAAHLKKREIDYVTFTSSSTVKNFAAILGKKTLSGIKNKTKWISIGPVTSATMRACGLKVHRQAREYTIPGLVQAICRS